VTIASCSEAAGAPKIFRPRCDTSITQPQNSLVFSNKIKDTKLSAAKSAAISADLAEVIAAWPSRPKAIKAAILALVNA
jgi:hypothetical protein